MFPHRGLCQHKYFLDEKRSHILWADAEVSFSDDWFDRKWEEEVWGLRTVQHKRNSVGSKDWNHDHQFKNWTTFLAYAWKHWFPQTSNKEVWNVSLIYLQTNLDILEPFGTFFPKYNSLNLLMIRSIKIKQKTEFQWVIVNEITKGFKCKIQINISIIN